MGGENQVLFNLLCLEKMFSGSGMAYIFQSLENSRNRHIINLLGKISEQFLPFMEQYSNLELNYLIYLLGY